jgi:chromosome partitioning protein
MKIITLANQKGGCGKSTIVLNLAIQLGLKQKKILIFDTDPQGSCIETLKRRSDHLVEILPIFSDIHREVQKYEETVDYIIIDTPPHDGVTMASAVICSDLVIIPVQDSPLDVRSTKTTVDLVNEARQVNPNIKAYFLLSRIQPKTVLARELKELLRQTYGFDILKTEMANRVAYKYAMIYGQGVSEFDRRDASSGEVDSLSVEIMNIVNH